MKKTPLVVFGLFLVIVFFWKVWTQEKTPEMVAVRGLTMGTIVYNVKYLGEEQGLQAEIDTLLAAFNQSLSTYLPTSEISVLNREGELAYTSRYFLPVLEASRAVGLATAGAFDPTVGPLINAWGFGPEARKDVLDSGVVDSLKQFTGFDRVAFDDAKVSMPPQFKLDFSAVAKGYAVDLVGELLEAKGVEDYMVEIGGELRCRGVNKAGKSWSIGVEDPTVNADEQKILAIVRMKDRALATSGNYRNYFEKDGLLYAHIIDPVTGYTSHHNLLSASVFADACMTADAYATAFMVLGLERSKDIIESNPSVDAILVYQTEEGLKSYVSKGIASFVELNKTEPNL